MTASPGPCGRASATRRPANDAAGHRTAPEFTGVGGRYLGDCHEAPVTAEGRTGVRPYAVDPEAAARLWDVTEELLAAPLR